MKTHFAKNHHADGQEIRGVAWLGVPLAMAESSKRGQRLSYDCKSHLHKAKDNLMELNAARKLLDCRLNYADYI